MKALLYNIIAVLYLCSTAYTHITPKQEKQSINDNKFALNVLSAKDKLKYKLTVYPGKKVHDKCLIPYNYYKSLAVLENNSTDTLKYIDWTCSHDIWLTNTNKTGVTEPYIFCHGVCHKNIISVYTIPPKKRKTFTINLYPKNRAYSYGDKFRVGIVLQRVLQHKDFNVYFDAFFGDKYKLHEQVQNVIWSDAVILPH